MALSTRGQRWRARHLAPLCLAGVVGVGFLVSPGTAQGPESPGAFPPSPVCTERIVDVMGVLGPPPRRVLEDSIARLGDMGADVRLVTTGPTANLDGLEAWLRSHCAAWKSPAGTRKSTLLVLMASPISHKMGIYFGDAWAPALGRSWKRIQQEQMSPRFREGDFVGGFTTAMAAVWLEINKEAEWRLDLALRMWSPILGAMRQRPALEPVILQKLEPQSHGIGVVMNAMFLSGVLGLIVLGLVVVHRRRVAQHGQQAQATRAMQQDAIVAAQEAATAIALLDRDTLAPHQQAVYDAAAMDYAAYRQLGNTDPDVDGHSRQEYERMRNVYRTISAEAQSAPERRVPRSYAWVEAHVLRNGGESSTP